MLGPNIQGSFNGGVDFIAESVCNGAFTRTEGIIRFAGNGDSTGSNLITFQAKSANSIYSSSVVQPKSITQLFMIKI